MNKNRIPLDRKCLFCGSNKTWHDKHGFAHWFRIPKGYICQSCYNKSYAKEHLRLRSVLNENWRRTHREEDRLRHNRQNAKMKIQVYSHYGGSPPKCKKCGFTDVRALSIDHINGDGAKQRREISRGGLSFYRWLRQNNYPVGYQILCMNCQFIKRSENRREHGGGQKKKKTSNISSLMNWVVQHGEDVQWKEKAGIKVELDGKN